MLELADFIFEFSQAVTWLPHGRAFRIHDKIKFMRELVPLFFNQTKIRSFNRQLHLWGFRRSGRGNDQVWYHDNFLRGKPEDMKLMVRTKIKGKTGVSSQDTRIPNFDALPPLPVCDKRPSAILDVMENAILKLPNSIRAAAHCVSAMRTMSMSHPQLGNVTAGNNYQMMMLPRTETPCQFTVNHHQDDAFQIQTPPTFHRSVSNTSQMSYEAVASHLLESQFMMQPCVPTTMPSMNHHLPQQEVDYIEPSPAAEHQTSVRSHNILQDNLSDFSLSSLQHNEDFEPLPFMDDSTPCDDFASFIEGAIQHIEC